MFLLGNFSKKPPKNQWEIGANGAKFNIFREIFIH